MIKLFRLAGLLLCITAGSALAASPTVVESFGCNYVGEKDRAELDRALELWSNKIKAINNADLNQYRVFILTPVRSSTEFDLMWLGVSPNLAIWGNGLDIYTSSSEGKEANMIFEEVIDCESGGLWFSEQVLGQ